MSDDQEQELFVAFHELGDFLVTAQSYVDTTRRRWWKPWAIRPGREGIGFRGVSLDDPDDIIYAYVIPGEQIVSFYVGPFGDPDKDDLIGAAPQ